MATYWFESNAKSAFNSKTLQKHFQETHSDEITFAEEFYKNFDITATEVTISDSVEDSLMIALGEVFTEETEDGDAYYIEEFNLVDYNGELKAHVKEEHGFKLYMTKEMVQLWKQFRDRPIPVDAIDDMSDDDEGTVLFNIEVKSKAVSQSIQQITQILDSKDHMGFAHDLDGFCQKYAEIMMDAGINYNLVHLEMVTRALLRKRDNELEQPDFGPNGDHEDYVILRLTTSLSKNPSPMIRLSSGWLKKALTSTALYQASAPSHLDPLFVPVLADVI